MIPQVLLKIGYSKNVLAGSLVFETFRINLIALNVDCTPCQVPSLNRKREILLRMRDKKWCHQQKDYIVGDVTRSRFTASVSIMQVSWV